MMPDQKIIGSAQLPMTWIPTEFHVKHIHDMELSDLDQRTVAAYDNFDDIIVRMLTIFMPFLSYSMVNQ